MRPALFTLLAIVLCNSLPGQVLSLDPLFGDGGKVLTQCGVSDQENAMAVQADGKIVVAGSVLVGGFSEFVVFRYNSDGTPDISFDGDGKVTTAFGVGTSNEAKAVAIQADGKIVAAGYSYTSKQNFALARYNPDGSLDASFNNNGRVVVSFGNPESIINGIAIQSDRKIVAAGKAGGYFALARFNPDGTLDPGFEDDGLVLTSVSNASDQAKAVTIQTDGKIVAAGSAGYFDEFETFGVVRYNPDGHLDSTFDGDGKVRVSKKYPNSGGGRATAWVVGIQTTGKILVGGTQSDWIGDSGPLIRLKTNGTIDSTFGTDGLLSHFGRILAMAVQPDDKIVVAGSDFRTMRYHPNGSLDLSVTTYLEPSAFQTACAISLFEGRTYVASRVSRRSPYPLYDAFGLAAYKVIYLPPTVTSLSPSFGPVGTTVILRGSNFNATASENSVYFGAVRANVTAASTGSLTVSVPAGGNYQPLSVTNKASGLTGYSSKPFMSTFANPFGTGIPSNFYQPKVDFATGLSPAFVTTGDLDNDGKPDLVIANNGSNTLSVLRNTSTPAQYGYSTASFAPKVDFTTGLGPRSVVIADIDGDGKRDIVVANSFSATLSVFRNTSETGIINQLSFAPKVDLITDSGPWSVAVNDVDGDGRPEIVVANYYSRSISLFRNTSTPGSIGNASFANRVTYLGNLENYVEPSLALADLNQDGKPDMITTSAILNIVVNRSSRGIINSSSFENSIQYSTPADELPYKLAIGDLDGNGSPEIILSNKNGANGKVSIYRNKSGQGSYIDLAWPRVEFQTGSNPTVIIGDVDGDGKPDLITNNDNANGSVSVLRNTAVAGSISASSFAGKVDFAAGGGYSAVVGDMDGDGIAELVTGGSSNAISILKIAAPKITFSGKVFLQGAYNMTSGIMNTTLNTSGILQAKASIQPYDSSLNYPGTEMVEDGFFAAHPTIVDWILVELRDSITPSIVVARRAAFITQDGTLVDVDGSDTLISFVNIAKANYFVGIRHRNHLGIRSATTVNFSDAPGVYDFTTAPGQSYQAQPYTATVQMGNRWAMRGGNANANDNVKYNGPANDQNHILNNKLKGSLGDSFNNVYEPEDINMNGTIKWNGPGNDQNFLLNFILEGILGNIFVEQL